MNEETKQQALLPEENPTEKYRVYPQRFSTLLIYCIVIGASSTLRLSFSSIEDCATSYWNVDESDIDWLITICYLLYPIGSAIGEMVQSKNGFCAMVYFGAFFTVLGTLFRWASCLFTASDWGYSILMFGQMLGGIGLPPVLNGGATLASNWFSIKGRDNALAATIIAYYTGFCLSYLMSVEFVTEDSEGNVNGMSTFLLIEVIMNLVAFILVYIQLEEHPPTPPSFAAENKKNLILKARQQNVTKGKLEVIYEFSSTLMQNKQYILFVVGFSVLAATYQSIFGLIDEYVAVSGYTDDDSAVFAMTYLGAGMVSLLAITFYIAGNVQFFPLLLKISVFGVWVSGVAFVYYSAPEKYIELTITSGFIGLYAMPLVPVALTLAVECTYPMQESLSIGFAKSVSYLATVVGLLILDALIELQPSYYDYSGVLSYACIVLVVGFTTSAILLFLFKPELKRYEADQADTVRRRETAGTVADDV
mmetsp:Transcript_2426/g.3431  ORF Transcript_2426/g.3431 Transcript_2426/m.3431 type:complete len:478 (+) Transcript_2426:97-1530(+)